MLGNKITFSFAKGNSTVLHLWFTIAKYVLTFVVAPKTSGLRKPII